MDRLDLNFTGSLEKLDLREYELGNGSFSKKELNVFLYIIYIFLCIDAEESFTNAFYK